MSPALTAASMQHLYEEVELVLVDIAVLIFIKDEEAELAGAERRG